MKCPICDQQDDNIWVDQRDGSWTPCYRCAVVIGDSLFCADDELDDVFIVDEDFDQQYNPELEVYDVGC